MAEEPVSFGISDARRIDRAVVWYEHNVIDAREPRKQKQFPRGGVGGKIWFKVISISDYYWEVPGCEYIRAEVTQKSCNANVAIGDVVYIFDPFFCWFNLPIAIMMRITGTATFAENGFWDGVTPLVCGVTPGKCFWSVDSVCCLEEDYGTV